MNEDDFVDSFSEEILLSAHSRETSNLIETHMKVLLDISQNSQSNRYFHW